MLLVLRCWCWLDLSNKINLKNHPLLLRVVGLEMLVLVGFNKIICAGDVVDMDTVPGGKLALAGSHN